jgi:hypothetical protein
MEGLLMMELEYLRENRTYFCACLVLREGDYIHCHGKVANIFHQELSIKCGLSKGPPVPIINIRHNSVTELMNCTITSLLQVFELSMSIDQV